MDETVKHHPPLPYLLLILGENVLLLPAMVQVIELVMEVVLLRQNSIEQQLKTLFAEGDANGDGVLSYEEFTGIVRRCARAWHGLEAERTLAVRGEMLRAGKFTYFPAAALRRMSSSS